MYIYYNLIFGKPTKLAHLVFQETTISNTETNVVSMC